MGSDGDGERVGCVRAQCSRRAAEKARRYVCNTGKAPPVSCMHDIVRASLVVRSAEQVTDLVTALRTRERLERERAQAGGSPCAWNVVRVKNRFERPLLHGYRDLLLSLRVRCPSGAHHVCELQARSAHDSIPSALSLLASEHGNVGPSPECTRTMRLVCR